MIKRMIIVPVLLFSSILLLGQQDIYLHLKINNQQKLTVYHDEPLLLSLSISNPKASEDEQWNRSAKYKSDELDKAYHEKKISEEKWREEKQQLDKNKKQQQTIRIGSDAQLLQQLIQLRLTDEKGKPVETVFMKLLDSAIMPAEMILDANAYYLFRWGIDRETVLGLPPGKYFINVHVEDYVSSKIELTIKNNTIPYQVLQSSKTQYELGSFALQYGKPDTAIYHARKILKTESSSIDALVLLGDAYANKKNYAEALRRFESALKNFKRQYPNSPEPPLYITSMISWLKEQDH